MKNKIDTIMDKEDFFSNEVDIVKSGISELSKDELIELIKILNRSMVSSTENWSGG